MRIAEEEAAHFIALYNRLFYFAGQRRDIIPSSMSFNEFHREPIQIKFDCRDAIYEPSPLLEDFLAASQDSLSEEEQNIVQGWENYVRGTFTILNHLKKYSIFLGSESPLSAFGVLSLNDDLEETFPKPILPIFVKTVLLPYKGVIVYDGLLSTYNILIGPHMRANMKEDYRDIKREGRFFTTLWR